MISLFKIDYLDYTDFIASDYLKFNQQNYYSITNELDFVF